MARLLKTRTEPERGFPVFPRGTAGEPYQPRGHQLGAGYFSRSPQCWRTKQQAGVSPGFIEFQVAGPMEGHKSRIEGRQFLCGEEDRRLLLPVGANPLPRDFSLDKRKGCGSKLVEIKARTEPERGFPVFPWETVSTRRLSTGRWLLLVVPSTLAHRAAGRCLDRFHRIPSGRSHGGAQIPDRGSAVLVWGGRPAASLASWSKPSSPRLQP